MKRPSTPLLFICALGGAILLVTAGLPLARYIFSPRLVLVNASGEPLTHVSYQDTRTSGTASAPAQWSLIAPNTHVIHRIRGDDHILFRFTHLDEVRTHQDHTPAGPTEIWVITVNADGTTQGRWGKRSEFGW